MKTEQEQIEEIVKILLEATTKCFDTDCNHCDYQYEKDCNQYRKALALVQAGYGDVTEYKAEIERLKAENGQSRKSGILGYNATVEFHDDAVYEPSADCKDIEKYSKQFRNRIISVNEKEIKQAKLNILSEMWARISHNKTLIQSHITDGSFTIEDIYMEIDELMAEVENGKDKD